MNPNRNIFNCSYSIMSRRKQSNPKPLLKRDDEEVTEENAASTQNETTEEVIEAHSPQSETSKSNSPESPIDSSSEMNSLSVKVRSGEKRPLESDDESNSASPIPTAKIMPTLRLNIALASDPASNPEAKELRNIKNEENKSEDDEVMSNHEDAESILDSVNLTKAALKAQQQHQQQQQLLAAPKSKENNNSVNQLLVKNLEMLPRPNVFMCTPCGIRFSSLSTLEAHQTYYCSHRKDADESPSKPGSTADTNGGEPPTKSIKTGKQYACTQCSYSADKKVSLNRHMRMHQTSPTPSSTTSNGDENSSQIVVQQIIGQPPQPIVVDRYCSNCDIRFSSTKTYRAHKQHYCSSRHRDGQPATAPTTLPSTANAPNKPAGQKSGSQSPQETAKSPSISSQPFLALPTNPIIIIPYSLIRNASVIPGPLTSIAPVANSDSACFIFQNGSLQPIAISLPPATSSTSNAQQSTTPSRTPSVTPQIPTEVKANKASSSSNSSVNQTGEVLKAINKRGSNGNRETSTPLDLSVRRMSPGSNSRERSLSLSSAISADQFRMEFDAMMEGKENMSVSGDSITPEQIVCAPSLPGSPPLTPSPKRRSHSPRGSSVSISPNSSTSHSLLMRPLLPADIALRLSDPALNVIPQQMLVKQSMELALRLSSSGTNEATNAQQISPSQPITSPTGIITPTPIPPQMFVKTGMSKCKECNIVFCKYENYLAHKKHYCSARIVDDADGNTKAASPPNSPPCVSPSGAPLTYQQLICVACGIKFTSLDNLNAHQMYYCPKRSELQAQVIANSTSTPSHKEKCSKCKTSHDLSQACTTAGQGAYKCPICEVISPNSSEARRHMETHGGVKAFRCTICRYKGNTLRGMRTHIRMHIDKKSGDFNEENYISCILDDDSTEIPPAAAAKTPSPEIHEQMKINVIKHSRMAKSPIVDVPALNGSSNNNVVANSNAIKMEPDDLSQDVATKENEVEEVVDEPSLIPENIIKVEIEEKQESSSPILQADSPRPRSQKIHLAPPKIPSPSEALRIHSPAANVIHIQSTTPPMISPNGSRYCTNCDISFNYAHTFLAHKKFYCKPANKVDRPSNGPSPNNASNQVVVTLAAETSVL